MRYDDRYTHHDEDDLWDDELELSTDDRHTTPDDESPYQYTSDSHYAPWGRRCGAQAERGGERGG
ncbi:MAG: hypothetical protein K2J34_03055, partial [Muribaculaceae bacterium]|nr:hypothetical protein [Muribaculaceae bacterium]